MTNPINEHPLVTDGASPSAKAIDLISKSVAAFAILLYGGGFLVNSIYHFSYGFVDTNPLRPHVASAGAWFIVFLAIPIALIKGIGKTFVFKFDVDDWSNRFSTNLYIYCVSSYWVGLVLSEKIFPSEGVSTDAPEWVTVLKYLIFAVATIFFLVDRYRKLPRLLPTLTSLALAGLLMAIGTWNLWGPQHRVTEYSICSWFLLVAAFFHISIAQWRLGNWFFAVSLMMSLVVSFATGYYPRLSSAWGGGALVPVTIFFTKDSTVLPSQSSAASLLDETDAGFYVVGLKDKKATFIPRSAVALVYYSDDASGSFLSNPKPVN